MLGVVSVARKILEFFRPFVVWLGKLKLGIAYRNLTGEDYYHVRDRVHPGCVLLLNKNWEPSNIINRGKFKHGELYIGGIPVKYTIGSTGRGVGLTNLVDAITQSDAMAICTPKFLHTADIPRLEYIARSKMGVPYDYLFQLTKDSFYCFEFIATCYLILYPDLQLKTTKIFGHEVFTWETFTDPELFDVQIIN